MNNQTTISIKHINKILTLNRNRNIYIYIYKQYQLHENFVSYFFNPNKMGLILHYHKNLKKILRNTPRKRKRTHKSTKSRFILQKKKKKKKKKK